MLRQSIKSLILISFAPVLAPAVALSQPKIETGTYQIDPMHSKVGFEVPHLVISTVEGTFKEFDGQLDLASDFTKSKVTANVKVASIDTGVEKRDDHLKSADFFDAAKHPLMTFKSTSIKGTPESFKISGDLTLHGVKKPVTFDGQYLGTVTDGYGNRKAAFVSKAVINRKDFGLNWNSVVEAGPVVGDKVTLVLKIQGAKATDNAQAKK